MLNQSKQPQTIIDQLALQLNNEPVNKVIGLFHERKIATYRAVIMTLALIWTWAILNFAPQSQHVIIDEARKVLPSMVVVSLISIAWMVAIKVWQKLETYWTDLIWIFISYAMLTVLLKQGFIILITLNAFLPYLSITIGVRYTYRLFILAVLLSVTILLYVGPDGYWISRPAYALYAIVLATVLPIITIRLFNALRDVSVQAVKARDAQQRFISSVSHELRTPLNAIVNFGNLFDTREFNQEQTQMFNAIRLNSTTLFQRVNSILDVASIQRSTLYMRHEPFYISNVIQSLKAMTEALAQKKNIDLTITVNNLGLALEGDSIRIENIFGNLLQNAIKFTPNGGRVSFDLKCHIVDRKAHVVAVVQDNGPGISDEAKSHIFDPFFQISTGITRNYEGSGLGLYIVKSISDQMQASIQVQDAQPTGTVFTWQATFDVAQHQPAQIEGHTVLAEIITSHRLSMPSLQCLVVDDVSSNLEVITAILSRAGHRVTAAYSGEACLEQLRLPGQHFDIILLDIHMPTMSGWDVINALREDSRIQYQPPILMLSADVDSNNSQQAIDFGTLGILIKPINPVDLLAQLKQLYNPNQDIEVKQDNVWSINEIKAIIPEQQFQQFMEILNADIQNDTLNIGKAWAEKHHDNIRQYAHRLKNAYAILNSEQGLLLCQAVQDAVDNDVLPNENDITALVTFGEDYARSI